MVAVPRFVSGPVVHCGTLWQSVHFWSSTFLSLWPRMRTTICTSICSEVESHGHTIRVGHGERVMFVLNILIVLNSALMS